MAATLLKIQRSSFGKGLSRPLENLFYKLPSARLLAHQPSFMSYRVRAISTTGKILADDDPSGLAKTQSSGEEVLVEIKNQVLWLKFNRPKKYNAITTDMFEFLTDQLTRANSNTGIKIVVLTGVGKYYSSGNDLSNFLRLAQHKDGFKGGASVAIGIFKRFVESLINLNKFSIAAVNGPSVGLSVTTLPLLDYIICSDTATFHTPFTALGQSPEACSTVTFPSIMGVSRASEILLMNKVLNATDAMSSGLVSNVVPSNKLEATLNDVLYGEHGMVKTCYPKSLKIGKSLIKNEKRRRMLLDVNAAECEALLETWLGEEVQDALKKFFATRAK